MSDTTIDAGFCFVVNQQLLNDGSYTAWFHELVVPFLPDMDDEFIDGDEDTSDDDDSAHVWFLNGPACGIDYTDGVVNGDTTVCFGDIQTLPARLEEFKQLPIVKELMEFMDSKYGIDSYKIALMAKAGNSH
jgi:hypothetical protein